MADHLLRGLHQEVQSDGRIRVGARPNDPFGFSMDPAAIARIVKLINAGEEAERERGAPTRAERERLDRTGGRDRSRSPESRGAPRAPRGEPDPALLDELQHSIQARWAQRRAARGPRPDLDALRDPGMELGWAMTIAHGMATDAGSDTTRGRMLAREVLNTRPDLASRLGVTPAARQLIAGLDAYNRRTGALFEEREVAAAHRKPCDDCGADFNDGHHVYFVDQSAFFSEKLCKRCMRRRIQCA